MTSSCKKEENPQVNSKKQIEAVSVRAAEQPIEWENYAWAALHEGGGYASWEYSCNVGSEHIYPVVPIAGLSYVGLDATGYILDMCYTDPTFVPQSGNYVGETYSYHWDVYDMLDITLANFWYHKHLDSNPLPNVYNAYYTPTHWQQYPPRVKTLVLAKMTEILNNMGIPASQQQYYKVYKIGFGNDAYIMPGDTGNPLYEQYGPGNLHALQWFEFRKWQP